MACIVLLSVRGAGSTVIAVAAAIVAAGLLVVRFQIGRALAGRSAACALALLTALALSVLLTTSSSSDFRLCSTLLGLALIPLAAATAPAIAFVHLDEGRRIDVMPSLLGSAACGGLGILLAIAVASIIDSGDTRLETLVPYVAAGAAMLGLADVLAHHRIGAGFARTVAVCAGVALLVRLILVLDNGRSPESAVTGTVVGAGAVTLGLVIATVLATPRSFVVPVDDTVDGPRLFLVVNLCLLAVGAALRLLSARELWIDEAATADATAGSFASFTNAEDRGHAHPPLHDTLVWVSRHIFGSDPWALRLPSLLAGLALIPVVYVTAAKLFDRRVGIAAAAIVAVGPGFVWLSDEAQPGALAALGATVALLALLNAFEHNRISDWLLFGAAGAGLVWSHQLGIVPAAILLIAAGVTAERRKVDHRWLIAAAITVGATVALIVYRNGFGPSGLLAPFEYATDGAPAAGRSLFGLTGIALTGLVGFHPPAITSRLLALWPLCMLAAFVLLGRAWTRKGALVVALATAPFVTLLLLQVFGIPRSPPFALVWTATAMPMMAIGVAYAIGHAGRWRYTRVACLGVAAVLLLASIDQRTQVEPKAQYDVSAAIDEIGDEAQPGDTVVYAPDDLRGLVQHSANGATVVPAAQADPATLGTGRVLIIGAFSWRPDDASANAALELVHNLSASRPVTSQTGNDDVKVWVFG
jgi:uncharacterized membrane protein